MQTLSYSLVEERYPAFSEAAGVQAMVVPRSVQWEFQNYLKCGQRLERGS